ncbi:MAG: aminoacyl-tRNA hydrolase [Acidimicrobiales bacterium]|nr:aminoacyl-tRNA hydrolase [Acidimicrobiales bacterium]
MEDLRTPGGVPIAGHALRLELTRAGGPGGQHVNTSATRVTVVLDVTAGLPPAAAARVRARHGDEVRVSASTNRSQWRNRREALERLARLVDAAQRVQPPRRATKVPKGERRRRVEDKQRRSRRLAQRRIDDD